MADQQQAISAAEDCDDADQVGEDVANAVFHFSLLSKRRLFALVSWFPLGRRVGCGLHSGLRRGLPGGDPQHVEVFGEGHAVALA